MYTIGVVGFSEGAQNTVLALANDPGHVFAAGLTFSAPKFESWEMMSRPARFGFCTFRRAVIHTRGSVRLVFTNSRRMRSPLVGRPSGPVMAGIIGTLISLEDNGRPILGMIDQPCLGERFISSGVLDGGS